MHTLKQRHIVVVAALLIAAPLALFLQYDVSPPAGMDVFKAVPEHFGEWRSVAERLPSKEEVEILETKAIMTRSYVRGNPPEVDLSAVYAKDNRRVAHPPELCYKGSGWNVEKTTVAAIQVAGRPFHVNQLLLIRGERRLLVLYWFKAGSFYSASYLKMQWNIIKSHLVRRGSSSALLRVSALSMSPSDDEKVLAALREFAALAIPALNKALP